MGLRLDKVAIRFVTKTTPKLQNLRVFGSFVSLREMPRGQISRKEANAPKTQRAYDGERL